MMHANGDHWTNHCESFNVVRRPAGRRLDGRSFPLSLWETIRLTKKAFGLKSQHGLV